MEPNEKVLKPEESLQIIEKMINRTKGNLHDNSFYFLLWGWIVLIGNVGQIVFSKLPFINKPYIIWFIVIPGFIASMVYGMKQNKKTRFFSHLDLISSLIWFTFFISYIIVIIFMKEFNYKIGPMIFLFAGNATFLTGVVIKFKPLIWGGIFFWIGALFQFIVPIEYIDYVSPVVIIFGYLVPGYLLKSYNKKNA